MVWKKPGLSFPEKGGSFDQGVVFGRVHLMVSQKDWNSQYVDAMKGGSFNKAHLAVSVVLLASNICVNYAVSKPRPSSTLISFSVALAGNANLTQGT